MKSFCTFDIFTDLWTLSYGHSNGFLFFFFPFSSCFPALLSFDFLGYCLCPRFFFLWLLMICSCLSLFFFHLFSQLCSVPSRFLLMIYKVAISLMLFL